MRITSLPAGTQANTDYIAVDNTSNGTRKLLLGDLSSSISDPTHANGLLDYAVNVAPTGMTAISPRNMGTSDLPTSDYAYGSAIILKRSSTAISVTLFGDASRPGVISNAYANGTWFGWRADSGIYINSSSDFYSALSSLAVGYTANIYLSSATTNAVFSDIGSEAVSGMVTKLSDTVAGGLLITSGDNEYRFQANPSSQTVNTLTKTTLFQNFNRASASSHKFNIPGNYRGVLISISTTANNCGAWIITASGAGAIGRVEIKGASNITFSTATNQITIGLSSAAAMRYLWISATGEVTAV